MTWFKIDDGFWSHPKTMNLSDSAVALWTRAGAYSCQHLTDGLVPAGSLRALGTVEAAAELVEAGLWVDAEGGYVFHDWDEYQESSVTVKRRRDAARDRKRKQRRTEAGRFGDSRRDDDGSHGPVTRDTPRDSHGDDGGTHANVTPVVSPSPVTPSPTRPDPTRPDPCTS